MAADTPTTRDEIALPVLRTARLHQVPCAPKVQVLQEPGEHQTMVFIMFNGRLGAVPPEALE